MPTPVPTRPASRAFTLIEVLMAVAISSLVMGTLVSLLLLTSKSTPTPQSAASQSLAANHAFDELAADLARATAIISLGSESVELLLPDLDGNGKPDRVLYYLDDDEGKNDLTGDEPLLRAYAGSLDAPYARGRVLVSSVSEFTLVPETLTVKLDREREVASAPRVEIPLASSTPTVGSRIDPIDASLSFGQRFTPALPSGSTTFTVTRVSLRLARTGTTPSGTLLVSITGASGTTPTSTVFTGRRITESELPTSLDWVDIGFTSCPDLPAGGSYAVTIVALGTSQPDDPSAHIQWLPEGVSPGGVASTSVDQGQSWSGKSGTLLFRLYGTANSATSRTTPAATRTELLGLTVHLRPDAPGAARQTHFLPARNLPDAP